MSKRAEEAALKAYPVKMTPLVYQDLIDQFGGKTEIDVNTYSRCLFQEGYEQAEKDTREIIASCRMKNWREGYDDGYKQAEKDAIERVIDWVRKNAYIYTDIQNDEEGNLMTVFLEGAFVDDLTKAMEE